MFRPLLLACLAATTATLLPAQCVISNPTNYIGDGDDELFPTHYPLGFPITIPGSAGTGTWTHFQVCTNGWIVLTNGTTGYQTPGASTFVNLSLQPLYGNTGSSPIVAPYWGDLDVRPGLGGGIWYETAIAPGGIGVTWISWRNVVDFGSNETKSFEVHLWSTGRIEFVYSAGMHVAAGAPTYVALTCRNGVAVQPAVNFVPGPITPAVPAMHEVFTAGPFDLGGKRYRFQPNGSSWTGSVVCSAASEHESFGSGCYRLEESIYQLLPTPQAAAPALIGNAMRLTPSNAAYTASWLPGGASGLYVPQPPTATTLPSVDDGEYTYSWFGQSFQGPLSAVSSLRISTNAVVTFGNTPIDWGGAQPYEPSAGAMLASTTGGVYSWHDLDASAGGSIWVDEVGSLIVVTWVDVPTYGVAGSASTLQMQFDRATGAITVLWPSIANVGGLSHLVAWSAPGASSDPGSVSLAGTLPRIVPVAAVEPLTMTAAQQGAVLTHTVQNIPETSPGSGVTFGVVILDVAGIAGGMDLTALGMPDCRLYVGSLTVMLPFLQSAPVAVTTLTTQFNIPSGVPAGLDLFAQAAALIVPGSWYGLNAAGIVTSNGVVSHLGH